MRSDLKKLGSFTLETSKNHLIRNFLRNGRLRVKHAFLCMSSKFEDEIKSEKNNGQFLYIRIKRPFWRRKVIA